MAHIAEIAPDLFRISVYVQQFDLQFNHFLLRDDQPLLYHTGMRRMFPEISQAVATLIEPSRLRWIAFSHFEVDECGALNDWLQLAPQAQAATGFVGAMVNLADFAIRPARTLAPDEVLATGRYRFRYVPTPHVPHGWDAGVMFEETQHTLLCSDLFHQSGQVEPLVESDVIGRTRAAMIQYQAGPLMDYSPYHTKTRRILERLAALRPTTLAIMHGSSYRGNGAAALLELDGVLREVMS
jgi:flavorubredoxin